MKLIFFIISALTLASCSTSDPSPLANSYGFLNCQSHEYWELRFGDSLYIEGHLVNTHPAAYSITNEGYIIADNDTSKYLRMVDGELLSANESLLVLALDSYQKELSALPCELCDDLFNRRHFFEKMFCN